jgi:tetratricopeptide (TPR) repeat protein
MKLSTRYLVKQGGRRLLLLAALTLTGTLLGGRAEAADAGSDYRQKATTAFALGKYAVAGENFEQAFELTPEPSLLYNAAQAYRLAGNKERALTLYENYQRVYGSKDKREEIETRIAELRRAIEHDKAVATRPPNGTEPSTTAGAPSAPAPARPAPVPVTPLVSAKATTPPPEAPRSSSAAASAAVVLVNQPSPPKEDDRPLTSRAWFWGAVGGGVVAAAVVAILVASSGATNPSASLGKVNGN